MAGFFETRMRNMLEGLPVQPAPAVEEPVDDAANAAPQDTPTFDEALRTYLATAKANLSEVPEIDATVDQPAPRPARIVTSVLGEDRLETAVSSDAGDVSITQTSETGTSTSTVTQNGTGTVGKGTGIGTETAGIGVETIGIGTETIGIGTETIKTSTAETPLAGPSVVIADPGATGVREDGLGAANNTLLRLTENSFADGVGEIATVNSAGTPLPDARAVSNELYSQGAQLQGGDLFNDQGVSAMLWQFLQSNFDHETNLTNATNANEVINQPVPEGDPFFDPDTDLPFKRLVPVEGTGAEGAPREFSTVVTSFFDLSMVYGSSEAQAAPLVGEGGKLLTDPDGGLPTNAANGFAIVGDVRGNEHPELTAQHELWVRNHNRLVDTLTGDPANAGMTDQELFDKARLLNEAQVQAIMYRQALPLLLGRDPLEGYTGFDPSVDPTPSVEFTQAGFRLHSGVEDIFTRVNNDGSDAGTLLLGNTFLQSQSILGEAGPDTLFAGASEQLGQAFDDPYMTKGLTNLLRDVTGNVIEGAADGTQGSDLVTTNIARGRDVGIQANFNAVREQLGLPRVESIAELTDNPLEVAKIQELYGSLNPDDIDFFVAMDLERATPPALVGETRAALIADQAFRLAAGDPTFYLAEGSGLTAEEIAQVESTSLGDIMELNSASGFEFQEDVFATMDRTGGTTANDTLVGTAERDFLLGLEGDDTLAGGVGDDEISGGAGNDTLTGGTGNDLIAGGAGTDTFKVDILDGSDSIQDFEIGADKIDLRGADTAGVASFEALTLTQDGNNAVVGFGDASQNTLTVENVAADQLTAADFQFGAAAAPQEGTAGDDTVTGDADTILGTAANDALIGTPDRDIILGLDGNDNLAAGVGDDEISGGGGNDTITGGVGDDLLIGGAGTDTFKVGILDGSDSIQDFEVGADKIDLKVFDTAGVARFEDLILTQNGGNAVVSFGDVTQETITLENVTASQLAAADFLFGSPVAPPEGNQVPIQGTAEDDTLTGTEGRDTLLGLVGNDTIDGGAGNDAIEGADGNDIINGGDGQDLIGGGGGADAVTGGAGNDRITTGAGADTIIVGAADGNDAVIDFQQGDKVDLGAFAFDDIADLNLQAVNGNVVAQLGNGQTLTFETVTIEQFANEDFIFTASEPDPAPETEGEVINGDAIGNTLTGTAGNGTLNGFDGDDTTLEESRSVTLEDLQRADLRADQLQFVNSEPEPDPLEGESNESGGNNRNNTVTSADANDAIFGSGGNDTLNGGAGDDLISDVSRWDRFDLGAFENLTSFDDLPFDDAADGAMLVLNDRSDAITFEDLDVEDFRENQFLLSV